MRVVCESFIFIFIFVLVLVLIVIFMLCPVFEPVRDRIGCSFGVGAGQL